MTTRILLGTVALSVVVMSCGASSPASPTTAISPPATDPAVVITTTTSPPEGWDLVVFGDSFAAKPGWPTQLAEMVSADLGVDVAVDGHACFGGCTALTRIQGSVRIQKMIENAELIVIQPQPGRVVAPLWRSHSRGDCGGDDGLACFREAEADFRTYVDELFAEVNSLSAPGTQIRAVQATGTWAIDSFHPGLRDTDPKLFDVYLENMLTLSDHVAEAAGEYCILVVDVNAIMSGPDYRQPVSPEYSDDGSHPSEEGSRVIAGALAALGFERTSEC